MHLVYVLVHEGSPEGREILQWKVLLKQMDFKLEVCYGRGAGVCVTVREFCQLNKLKGLKTFRMLQQNLRI